jgi:hypothetical protein
MSDPQPITTTSIHLQYDASNIISKLTNDLTVQTLRTAEQLAQIYVPKVVYKKTKLFKTREKLENKLVFDNIIDTIEYSIINMI